MLDIGLGKNTISTVVPTSNRHPANQLPSSIGNTTPATVNSLGEVFLTRACTISPVNMMMFGACKLGAAPTIAISLARRLQDMAVDNTSAVGRRVFVGLGQRKCCGFHITMVVRLIARNEK